MDLLYTKQFTFHKYINFFFLWSNPWSEIRGLICDPIRDPVQSDLVWSSPIPVLLTPPKMISHMTWRKITFKVQLNVIVQSQVISHYQFLFHWYFQVVHMNFKIFLDLWCC